VLKLPCARERPWYVVSGPRDASETTAGSNLLADRLYVVVSGARVPDRRVPIECRRLTPLATIEARVVPTVPEIVEIKCVT
jgi:hypothetical protein